MLPPTFPSSRRPQRSGFFPAREHLPEKEQTGTELGLVSKQYSCKEMEIAGRRRNAEEILKPRDSAGPTAKLARPEPMGSLRTLFSSRTPRSFLNKRRNRQLGKGTNLERNSRLESGRRARRDSAGKNRRDGKHQGNDFEPLGRSNDRNGRRLRSYS